MSDSDSDMDVDFDSEEELQHLRNIRQVMECDDDFVSSSPAPSVALRQDQQLQEASRRTASHYVNESSFLNKQLGEKLVHLEKHLERRLIECQAALKKVSGQILSDADRSESFRYINCGRPYFKDKENFSAPDNEDTIIMEKNHMYDFSSITSVPGWTLRDKTQLLNQIEKMTKTMLKTKYQSLIAELKRDMKRKSQSEKKDIEKQINKIRKDTSKLNTKKLNEIVLPINEEYDWEEVTHCLNRRHKPGEYQALWKLYLHPKINKSNWSKEEHQLLQKLAYEHELRDWERIAEELGTNRTGYQCFVYFRTNMNNTFTGKKWSDEEVDYLLRLIEYYKEDQYIPWVKVAALMENRTKIQIYNKYSRLMEQRKGRFLQEEDAVILTCADDFGPDFKKMSQFLPGRSVAQIRVRYQALAKKRVSTVWTVEEDRKLLQLLSNQDSAANYASISKFFPGKDRINIRARYVTLFKWMRRNPNADIINAPRRGSRRLGHGKASENLNDAIESLKSRIQTEVDKKRSNRINSESSEAAIEDSIIALMVNENSLNESQRTDMYDANHLSILENNSDLGVDAVNEGNLQKLLLLLRAKLNKKLYDKQFMGSIQSQLYPPEEHACVKVKVKSYSRQNTIKSIELNELPDVWGHNTFKSLEYVLPPQYATITGLKKLMTYVANKQKIEDTDFMNFSMLGRRNVLLREQLDILMERFNTLFLWPMLLSNEGPTMENVQFGQNATIKEIVSTKKRHRDKPESKICETSVPEPEDKNRDNESGISNVSEK